MTLDVHRLTPTLTVNDLPLSLRFYCEGLGFVLLSRFENQAGELRSVILQAGASRLGLTQDDFSRGRDRQKGVGLRLFLELDGPLEPLITRAAAAGLALSDPAPLPWGVFACSVDDPDGFALTFCQRHPG